MNIEDVGQYIEDAGLGELGKNIFINFMPDECDVGILLVNDLSGTPIDYELPGYRRTGFQIIVRHTKYEAGSTLAKSVSDLLTLENKPSIIPNMNVKYVRPRHEPVVFPRLVGNGLEFSVNFDACYVII